MLQLPANAAPAVVALAMLSGACTDDTLGLGNTETPDPLASCAVDQLKAVTLRRVAVDVGEIRMGLCGDIVYESGSSIDLIAPDLSDPVRIAEIGSGPEIGRSGIQLLYETQDNLRLRDLRQATEETVEASNPRYGFVQARDGTDIPWWCSDGVLQAWDESPVGASACPALTASRGPNAVWLDAEGLGLADLERGTSRRLAVDVRRSTMERDDGLFLSADGALMAYQRVNVVPCDDTFCSTPEGPIRFVSANGDPVVSLPGPFLGGRWRGLMIPESGHSMLHGTEAGIHWIDEDFTVHTRANYRSEWLAPDGRSALLLRETGETSSLVRQDRSSGQDTVLMAGLRGPLIRSVSQDGRSFALVHPEAGCIAYPDRPDVCHTQLWAAHIWHNDSFATYSAVRQPEVYWVGNDGSVVIGGRFLSGPVPEVAEPTTVVPRLCLIDAAQNEQVCWDDGEIGQVEPLANGLLVVVWRGSRLSARVEVVDPGRGRKSLLVESEAGARVLVDGSRRRLAIVTLIQDFGAPNQLWVASASGLLDP